jgi:hypothetical protein
MLGGSMVPDSDNVIPLRAGQDSVGGDLPVPLAVLAGAVGEIGHCLTRMELAAESGRDCGSLTLLHMAEVERRFEDLAVITVVTWPDVGWALRFCDARVRALATIRQLAAWSGSARGGAWPAAVLAPSGPVGRALREVRDLVVLRYPQTRQECL